mmetsp:Transcript_16251/g.51860  ORF Transcript_16251/g.51860 Transcript_16251/m.51860 type:complete len:279 (-) Transcript_16251:711-1547(-)
MHGCMSSPHMLRPSTPSSVPASPPSGHTRSRTRALAEEVVTESLKLDLCGDTLAAARRAALACGRRTPKDVMFKSPPRRVFESASEARASRLRARTAVPLSDLHGIGLPHALAQLGGPPSPHPFQSFAPSVTSADFQPIARPARPQSSLGGMAVEAASSCDYSAFDTVSSKGSSAGAPRPLETPPCNSNAFERIGEAGACRAPKRPRVLCRPAAVRLLRPPAGKDKFPWHPHDEISCVDSPHQLGSLVDGYASDDLALLETLDKSPPSCFARPAPRRV